MFPVMTRCANKLTAHQMLVVCVITPERSQHSLTAAHVKCEQALRKIKRGWCDIVALFLDSLQAFAAADFSSVTLQVWQLTNAGVIFQPTTQVCIVPTKTGKRCSMHRCASAGNLYHAVEPLPQPMLFADAVSHAASIGSNVTLSTVRLCAQRELLTFSCCATFQAAIQAAAIIMVQQTSCMQTGFRMLLCKLCTTACRHAM